jgi:hypothetical protein
MLLEANHELSELDAMEGMSEANEVAGNSLHLEYLQSARLYYLEYCAPCFRPKYWQSIIFG